MDAGGAVAATSEAAGATLRRPATRASAGPASALPLAGKAFLLVGGLGLLAALLPAPSGWARAATLLSAVVDVGLGVVLLGRAEWGRLVAIARTFVGLGSAALLPVLLAPTDRVLIAMAMRIAFYTGVLLLLPARWNASRWAFGAFLSIWLYLFLKLLAAIATDPYDAGEFIRAFIAIG